MGEWEWEREGIEGNERGRKWRGPQALAPYVRNPKKYPDYRTDLTGEGGNTDACPGRQTPSRRHCLDGTEHFEM